MQTLIKATQTYCEGNEHLGLTWRETETFTPDTPVIELLAWATRYPREAGAQLVLEAVTCNQN